jgi:hypothetical protein
MGDKIPASVQAPFFGYELSFKDKLFDLDKLDNVASKAAFEAFRPWNVRLENVTFQENAPNLAEEATNFNLLNGKVTFRVKPGGCHVAVANASWTDAPIVIPIVTAGTHAVLKATGAGIENQRATIGMHLTPQSGSALDVVSRFVRFDAKAIVGVSAQALGMAVHWDNSVWVIDKSALFENSIFVRLDRSFGADDSFEQIAMLLNDDERKLLDSFGLEVD